MGESFYTVLGVGTDADADAIERAYRERVKKHHPDVSDTPDAREKFKRLTVARDTLVDSDERFRYDTLGYERYVREHTPPGLFEVAESPSGQCTEPQPTADADDTASSKTSSQSQSTTADTSSAKSSATEATSRVATDGGARDAPWESSTATASGGSSHSNPAGRGSIYDTGSVDRTSVSKESRVAGLWETFSSLGPWLVIYTLGLVAVLAIGWPIFGAGIATGSAATAMFVSVIVVVTLTASALHFVSLLA